MLHGGRALRVEEEELMAEICRRTKRGFPQTNIEATYATQGNFTLCLLSRSGRPLAWGVAKRRVDDPQDELRAHHIAFARAVRDLVQP